MKLLVLVLLGIFLFGCITPPPPPGNNTTIPPGYEVRDYCKTDSDCVRLNKCCDCGLGEYVNKYNQVEVDCSGGPLCKCATFDSRGECENNRCIGVPVDQPPPPPPPPPPVIPPGYEVKDYCREDSDCVRLNKCCDCGIGEYVNKYNQVEPLCEGPACMCPIQLSHGECQDNRCVAVADEVPPPLEEKVTIFSGHGECGGPDNPKSFDTENGLMFRGNVSAPNPCHFTSVLVKKVSTGDDYYYVLNVTARPTDAEVCVQCAGYVPWEINITGYWGRVDIYYGGQKVFPDKAGFCGWSTNGNCVTNDDCMTGGCSGQVCQGKSEDPVITTCEWRDCYDSGSTGLGCGCVAGKCQWN